ncbi:hypothetical protein [Actinomadura rudentiformis]|uniref:Uncharacterized protein n=1 Tax=Actinomadura rudentiformis TaxID=359158 RepID=A0A6H9YMQ3_9ACTN|nr:hypothetical protein [Actinomadura rudentiformis]KAB2345974.1 hypothetical protein F8566_24960 [Actinomadura rudentiformis]
MFHNDIMDSVMRERVRDLQAQAKADRDATIVRRARKFWEDRTLRAPSRRSRKVRLAAEGR